jgi:hypothetical protein
MYQSYDHLSEVNCIEARGKSFEAMREAAKLKVYELAAEKGVTISSGTDFSYMCESHPLWFSHYSDPTTGRVMLIEVGYAWENTPDGLIAWDVNNPIVSVR